MLDRVSDQRNISSKRPRAKTMRLIYRIGQLLLTLCLFLIALNLMSESFKLFGTGFAKELVNITANPFISLFIGMLATAIIQSSSTTTTLIVALVASGKIELQGAVPLIMGTNIGTSVTSTIVSLGHISKREEFGLAVAGASLHDFFNIITVVILFTLEVTSGFLSTSASWLANVSIVQGGDSGWSLIFSLKDTAQTIVNILPTPWLTLTLGLIGLYISLSFLSRILRLLLVGQIEETMNKYVFGHPALALFSGFISTAAVQSSSVMSSLIVPLVATRKLTLEKAFPFLMGTNVGTTTTALIAAMFLENNGANVALACAFTHLLFNLFGVFILFPIKSVRRIPIFLAKKLGTLSMNNRLFGVAYVVIVFFVIPFILITLTT